MTTKPTILKWKGNLKADKIRDSAGTRLNMNYEQVFFFPKLKQNDPTIGLHSKLGKVYLKDIYCHHAYLTFMQSTLWEMLDWMKHKLESRLPGEISITSNMQMIPPLQQKAKKN